MKENAGSSRTVLLVHGTFAREAAWTQEGSDFRAGLTTALPGDTQFLSFDWSGRNTFAGRLAAVRQLRERIVEIRRHSPFTPLFVVAHSHGGNVLASALADPHVSSLVTGAICLSTPFLLLRRRLWNRAGRRLLQFGAASALVLLLMVCMWWLDGTIAALSARSLHPRTVEFVGWTFGFLVFSVFVAVVAWCQRKAREVSAMPSPTPAFGAERLLIIRSPADEASGLLTAAAFVSVCVGLAWAPVGRVADWITNVMYEIPGDGSAPLKPRRFASRLHEWALILFIILMIVGAAIQGLGFLPPGSAEAMVVRNWTVLPLLAVLLTPVIGAAAYVVLLIPFAAVIGVASVVAGPELFLAAFTHEIAIEPTPPGTWTVHQMFGLAPQRRLEHSSHSDATVPPIISEWIIGREADGSTGHGQDCHAGGGVTEWSST